MRKNQLSKKNKKNYLWLTLIVCLNLFTKHNLIRRIKKIKSPFVSYAQNLEDFLLWRALKNVKNGFYIDIGAYHPIEHSVSYAFYLRGWRGVNIEPNDNLYENFKKYRADEINKKILISNSKGSILFYKIKNSGLSTISKSVAEKQKKNGYRVEIDHIQSLTLDDLFFQYSHKIIHWLKIDVEGAEHSVINSWKKSLVRPWILCIESTEPSTDKKTHSNWNHLIISKGYKFIYFDGINRFYVHKSKLNLCESFKTPPNVLDNIIPYQFISFRLYLMTRIKLMIDKSNVKNFI